MSVLQERISMKRHVKKTHVRLGEALALATDLV